MKIRKVACLGANSAMGSKSAALIASFGDVPVFMVARTPKKAKEGIETAVRSVKSNSIRKNLIPATYKQLPKILAASDWVIEAVSEDFKIKKSVNILISKTQRKNRIISTLTSGLSISKLAEDFDQYDRKRYVGLHFFNPPYKMLLCELIPTVHTDQEMLKDLELYLGRILLRKVIVVKDTPAFIANRVGFQFMNEALLFAEKYKDRGGVAYIDALLGRHTGRTLGPLETIDFVGLDVHKAILSNLELNVGEEDTARETFRTPRSIDSLLKKGRLGVKASEGFYTDREVNGERRRFVFDIKTHKYIPLIKIVSPVVRLMSEFIRNGEYLKAFDVLKTSRHADASIMRYFIARYMSYSFSIVGSVADTTETVDRAMGFGFNWLPPSAMVDLLGGVTESVRLLQKHHLSVPPALISKKDQRAKLYTLQNELDYRSLLKL